MNSIDFRRGISGMPICFILLCIPILIRKLQPLTFICLIGDAMSKSLLIKEEGEACWLSRKCFCLLLLSIKY